MINNVVLVSGVQESDSVIHIHVSILFQILFPFRLLQSIEQSSLCCIVSPGTALSWSGNPINTCGRKEGGSEGGEAKEVMLQTRSDGG